VVPELRGGQPVWLVGRALGGPPGAPKYLGLAGEKPLLGREWAAAVRWPLGPVAPPGVLVVEGPFDWLTLVQWGLPAVALVGTHVRREVLGELGGFARLYLALDADDAGRAGAAALRGALGPRAVPVALPGVKDVAELAPHPDGCAVLAGSLQRAGLPAVEVEVARVPPQDR
jgi:DNA primase